MKLDITASQVHYALHMLPVWRALPDEVRGTFWVGARTVAKHLAGMGVDVELGSCRSNGPAVLTAGYHDLHAVHPDRTVIYLEHGVGQTYRDHPTHPSHPGGKYRDRVALFLVPGERSAALERERYPDARVEVIGCPRLDPFLAEPLPLHDPLVVAFAWHWDCPIVPETRWAFPQWRDQIRAIHASGEFQVIGTGHPRQWGQFQAFYDRHGIEAVADPNEVLERADVVCWDNTSFGFEAMACGLGVVGLNASWYRRDVDHGLRFWDLAPLVSLWPDQADLLPAAIREAALPVGRHTNVAMTRSLYPSETRGHATRLAVDAIMALLAEES